jgi:type I restriction enzyme R subunit
MPQWEKLSIFLQLLIPKLPSPKEEDLSNGILKAIDLDSYRAEVQQTLSLKLEDDDCEIDPINLGGQYLTEPEPEYDYLSRILDNFHKIWGNIAWQDEDNVKEQIKRIPEMVAKNEAYQNAMRNADEQAARMEGSRALNTVMLNIMQDCMELYKQYSDNQSFNGWLDDSVFKATYDKKRPTV